ncbi:MAG TPA: GNAT family N-acetyltransferase [Solirubrobacterales bacterium]|nr:GNAT family N-acetyltransferase [Solirubrobacterales bacterium]
MSGPAATAELIEDRGEAAAGDDFFRSRPFLDAEGVTHTLCIQADGLELLAPLIVREIEGANEHDAISPYGYPGLVERDRGGTRRSLPAVAPPGTPPIPPALNPESVDFSSTGLVSAFIRHTLDTPPLTGATERNVVQIADPELPRKSRGSDRNQVNKNLRNGYRLRLVPGPETAPAERAGFLAAYEQTMRRAGAGERYFFSAEYFDRILTSAQTWLALALAPDGGIAAASVAARSDGYLHYYLSGSADSHLRDSPMKNVVTALVDLSAELGLPLNLGGGIVRGDRLEEFKRGFANREQPWHTSEIVCDEAAYARLSAGRTAGTFFPAYRA